MDSFTQRFKHFLNHSNLSAERPALLILDGRKSHTNNLEVILLARQHNVHIVRRPPHCSHRLLPLDVSITKPLMTYYTQEGRKEMFYLTTHYLTTHIILRLYDVKHMVKDHWDNERGNPLPPNKLLFPISSKGSFICIIPQTG